MQKRTHVIDALVEGMKKAACLPEQDVHGGQKWGRGALLMTGTVRQAQGRLGTCIRLGSIRLG